jgi:hypothetical protein
MKQSVIVATFPVFSRRAVLRRPSDKPTSQNGHLPHQPDETEGGQKVQHGPYTRVIFVRREIEEREEPAGKDGERNETQGPRLHSDMDVALDQRMHLIDLALAAPLAGEPAFAFGGTTPANAAMAMPAGTNGVGCRVIEAFHRRLRGGRARANQGDNPKPGAPTLQ